MNVASLVVAGFVETVEWEDEGLPLPQAANHKHDNTHKDLSPGNGYVALWGNTRTVADYNGHPPDPQQFG